MKIRPFRFCMPFSNGCTTLRRDSAFGLFAGRSAYACCNGRGVLKPSDGAHASQQPEQRLGV